MEAGLTEIIQSLNRSWIYDTFLAYIAIRPGESPGDNVRGMSGYHTVIDSEFHAEAHK